MRTVKELNKNWYFQKENVGLPQELPCDWAKVDLPHTWNAVDSNKFSCKKISLTAVGNADQRMSESPEGNDC